MIKNLKLKTSVFTILLVLCYWTAIAQTFEDFQIPTVNSNAIAIIQGVDGNIWLTRLLYIT